MSDRLRNIIQGLDQQILNDPSLGPEAFARLLSAQRELGLLHGDRPTCPFLRPHILSRSQYESIRAAAETIAFAFEELVTHALESDELMAELGMTESEQRLARLNPGYSRLCVSSRLDAYLTESNFQFLEYNAESPAGVADQMQLEKILLELPQVKEFLKQHKHWLPEPHRYLLTALLTAYRETGGEQKRPHIAIVDWKGVATAGEFRVLQQYFESRGHLTAIVDPRQLHYDGKKLKSGNFRIDILYKRVIIHEFLSEFDETHALVKAYTDGRVCMANSFRSKAAHKKAGFAIMSDPHYGHLFTAAARETIRRHIPWTRRVRSVMTTFAGVERNLLDLIRADREHFVLKPNDDYGGHGVFLGWEMDGEEWEKAITIALERPYVVQERVPLTKLSMPMFTERVQMEELFVDFNPFLFDNKVEGALVRLSSSSLLNVTSGGGETALLVLEDM